MKKYNIFLSLVALMSLASCKGQEVSSSSNAAPSSSTSSYNPYGDENVVDIVVLAGQSNMEGHTWINKLLSNTPESKHNYYIDGFPNTEIMYYCNGGSILHVNIEAPFNNFDQAWKMLNYITDAGVTYFAFTTKIQACKHNHGFFGKVCPVCGEPVATEYSRIVGFYTPVRTYSKERKAEWSMREWENVNDN